MAYEYACHLFCYPDDIDELHKFAHEIGLKSSWFQNKKSLPHYDLTSTKRKLAVQHGAIDVDHHKCVQVMKAWRREHS